MKLSHQPRRPLCSPHTSLKWHVPKWALKDPLLFTERWKLRESQICKMAIKLVGSSPKSLGIWRVDVEPLLIITGLHVAETLSSDLGDTALWSLIHSEVHVKIGRVRFCFGRSGVACGISLWQISIRRALLWPFITFLIIFKIMFSHMVYIHVYRVLFIS